MIYPIKNFQNMFPVVFKSLARRKEMLTTFVYYQQLLEDAREALKERAPQERVQEEKHRSEQFLEAKNNFDRAHKAALNEVRKLQGRRVKMLRDTIRTIAEEEARIGRFDFFF